MEIRGYNEQDVSAMIRIWNEVVEEGVAFPQLNLLDEESGKSFLQARPIAEWLRTTEQS